MGGFSTQNHFGSCRSHHVKIGGNGSDAVEYDLFDGRFIVGDHAYIFAHFQRSCQDLFNTGNQIVFHQANQYIPFLDRFIGKLTYHGIIKCILIAEAYKSIQDLGGVIGVIGKNDP